MVLKEQEEIISCGCIVCTHREEKYVVLDPDTGTDLRTGERTFSGMN